MSAKNRAWIAFTFASRFELRTGYHRGKSPGDALRAADRTKRMTRVASQTWISKSIGLLRRPHARTSSG
jgi:hypothetical protein